MKRGVISDPLLIDVLLDRMDWPARLVRLESARSIGQLLQTEYREEVIRSFSSWMEHRRSENEVVRGLTAAVFAGSCGSEFVRDLYERSHRPSILGDLLVEAICGAPPKGKWVKSHYEEAPDDYDISLAVRSKENKFAFSRISAVMQELEQISGFPFLKQWAWEWDRLCREDNHHLSPHGFFTNHQYKRQYSMTDYRQSDLALSAFLRCIHFAVDVLGMPLTTANEAAAEFTPINFDLARIRPAPHLLPEIRSAASDTATSDRDLIVEAEHVFNGFYQTDGFHLVSLSGQITRTEKRIVCIDVRSFWRDLSFSHEPNTPRIPAIKNDGNPLRIKRVLYPVSYYSPGGPPSVPVQQCFYGSDRLCSELYLCGVFFPTTDFAANRIELEFANDRIEFRMQNKLIGFWCYTYRDWEVSFPVESDPPLISALYLEPELLTQWTEASEKSLCSEITLKSLGRNEDFEKFQVSDTVHTIINRA